MMVKCIISKGRLSPFFQFCRVVAAHLSLDVKRYFATLPGQQMLQIKSDIGFCEDFKWYKENCEETAPFFFLAILSRGLNKDACCHCLYIQLHSPHVEKKNNGWNG